MWYEIYEDRNNQGTRTLEICKNKKEAIEIRKKYLTSGLWQETELHIDAWKNKNNPEIIKIIC